MAHCCSHINNNQTDQFRVFEKEILCYSDGFIESVPFVCVRINLYQRSYISFGTMSVLSKMGRGSFGP